MCPQFGQLGASPWFWNVEVSAEAPRRTAAEVRGIGSGVTSTTVAGAVRGRSAIGRFTFFLSSSSMSGMSSSGWFSCWGEVASRKPRMNSFAIQRKT